MAGNKVVLAEQLAKHFYKVYDEERSTRKQLLPPPLLSSPSVAKDTSSSFYSIPQSIVSIDVGVKNLAYVHVTKDLRILDWKLHQFNFDVFEIGYFGPSVLSFIHDILLPKQDIENLGGFVVEHQPFRAIASFEILKVIAIETALCAVLLDRIKKGVTVETLIPLKTARFLDSKLGSIKESAEDSEGEDEKKSNSKKKKSKILNKSSKKEELTDFDDDHYTTWMDNLGKMASVSKIKKTGNANRKKLSKSIVKSWLADHKNLYTKEQLDYYKDAKKKDDLADCLLQAFSYYNYRKTSIREAFKWIDSQQTSDAVFLSLK
ncbi:10534_t:CDS:1 [Ambispora gerdemannii]|uniref:10534_t:CDS:1 n=1 Tax=Ambispora gerdemannii TaxID=144530 RepID=A0A9N8ZLB8_9GLOM|nr:10534_t:CDS:1 [Ambispora gerdemannii]